MKNSRILSENFKFLVVKFSIYLNWRVFVMENVKSRNPLQPVSLSKTTVNRNSQQPRIPDRKTQISRYSGKYHSENTPI